MARVCADQQNEIRIFEAVKTAVEDIATTSLAAENTVILTAIKIAAASACISDLSANMLSASH